MDPQPLGRRERQILDALYSLGPSSAADVRESLPDALSDSTVRTFLGLLEQKGHVEHTVRGKAYIYHPVVPRDTAAGEAIRSVVGTFFRGSAAGAISALLSLPGESLSDDELSSIEAMIAEARRADGGL